MGKTRSKKKKKTPPVTHPLYARTLKKLYSTPGLPTAFSSPRKLYLAARDEHPKITQATVKRWLESQHSYTRHKKVFVHFRRRKVITSGIDKQWQADLMEMGPLAKYNDNVRYILSEIDVFSRLGHLQPVKNKSAESVAKAFETILNRSKKVPEKLQTDDGTEFKGSPFQKMLRKRNIAWFSTNMLTKAQICERFNRTIKNMIYQFMTDRNTNRYIDHLQLIVKSYNSRGHRSLGGMAPENVTVKNEKAVFETQYGPYLRERERVLKTKKPKFCIGDKVRLSKYRGTFARSFKGSYTNEIFKIVKILDTHPRTYTIASVQNNEIIDGSFYGREITRVT
jgi:transposase InsO family protein